MTTFPTLHTKRLTLRNIQDKDISTMIGLLNNPNISQQILNIPYPFGEENALARVHFVTQGFKNKERYVFVITSNEQDEMIGQIGLHLDKDNNKAEIGYWVGEPYWGKGIATEATTAILKFGFEDLDLNKIFATHFIENPASGKVLINNGMIKEAELKDHYKHGDAYKSVIQYRLTKAEYTPQ